MNLEFDFYHLYSVFDDNGDWQALLPNRKLAGNIGDFFSERTGRGYRVRDEGVRNPLTLESQGPASKLPFFYRVGGADEQNKIDWWLGSFASYLDAKHYYYYGSCEVILCEPCVLRKIQPGREL